jgi:hypothetical protein
MSLMKLCVNRNQIGCFSFSGGFPTDDYWASTENTPSPTATSLWFNLCDEAHLDKGSLQRVRATKYF